MLRSAKDLKGYAIRAKDDEIGKVKEFLFDDQSWTIRYMVADTGGWLTGRLVLISPNALQGSDWENEVLPVSLTKEQVENAPSIYEDQPVSRQYEVSYFDYYGYPYYWPGPYPAMAPAFPAGAPANAYASRPPTTEPAGQTEQPERGDPHLRSTEEVSGYEIMAEDGEIGHLDDFLVDDASWRIEAVVVATRDWLPGKKVVISPKTIREVSWMEGYVRVGLRRDEIESGREYDPAMTSVSDGTSHLLV